MPLKKLYHNNIHKNVYDGENIDGPSMERTDIDFSNLTNVIFHITYQ